MKTIRLKSRKGKSLEIKLKDKRLTKLILVSEC